MDKKTKLLVCLGAATAANCIPCFDYYYEKAQAAGVASEDIQEAAELAYQIKNNVNMHMKNRIRKTLGPEGEICPLTGGKAVPTCVPRSEKS